MNKEDKDIWAESEPMKMPKQPVSQSGVSVEDIDEARAKELNLRHASDEMPKGATGVSVPIADEVEQNFGDLLCECADCAIRDDHYSNSLVNFTQMNRNDETGTSVRDLGYISNVRLNFFQDAGSDQMEVRMDFPSAYANAYQDIKEWMINLPYEEEFVMFTIAPINHMCGKLVCFEDPINWECVERDMDGDACMRFMVLEENIHVVTQTPLQKKEMDDMIKKVFLEEQRREKLYAGSMEKSEPYEPYEE